MVDDNTEPVADEAPPPRPSDAPEERDRTIAPADQPWNANPNGELWSDRLPLWDPRKTVAGRYPPIDPQPPEVTE